MKNYKITARIVGVLYIIGTVSGILSLVFGQSVLDDADYLNKIAADENSFVIGALFVLVMGLALAMVPVMTALAVRRVAWAVALSVVLWAGAQLGWLSLVADAETGRTWFFNPFAWQLLFFTGFALGAGWIRPPRPDAGLVAAAVLLVAIGVGGVR